METCESLPLFLHRNFYAQPYRGLIALVRWDLGEAMSGEAWSCFAHLPPGLIDPRSASLTLNWLKPRPTHAGFKLSRDEVDTDRYERNVRVQRQALFAGGFLAVGVTGLLLAKPVFALTLFESDMSVFLTVWAGVSSLLLSFFIYGLAAMAAMRYRRAEPRRTAFLSARVEFEQIDAWRQARCDPKFWSERLNEAAFEFEAAELLAGYLKTGQVMLTRTVSDYGVDVLACAPAGRIVALCKQWKGRKAGAREVRELAGSKAFFAADFGLLISLESPSDDGGQAADFAASQKLEFWDLAGIVAVAQQLRTGNGP